ncbi:MAG TPA: sigma-70 family RNA polymerase sigma factor, partial [Candidatus Mediterraneibacter norfolkensis]|nr:sigma-70 family RNA polymerase sigma factor [Candidatus Mediterraneibacter norfolkensis]
MTDPTEHLRLVKRAIRGNPDAYGQLIAGQQEYLYKMAFLYMKNKEDALDLVGSTVLKGYQNIHRLKNPEWFRTWLTRILINLARDELKKAVHHSDITELQVPEEPSGVSAEEKCDLDSAIRKLPDKYRTPLVLKYYSGLSIREIAYATGCPEGT